jgi:hypothetical protein
MPWPEERRADSYDGLRRSISELIVEATTAQHRWFYRGHFRSRRPLQPTIERRDLSVSARRAEGELLGDFRRLAWSLSERLPTFDDTPSWFALARHYGVPTRLLDWTDSSSVALFFACDDLERAADDPDQSSAVWALNATLIHEQFIAIVKGIEPSVSEWDLSGRDHFEKAALYAFDDPPKGDPNPHRKTGLVAELPPRRSNPRMAFQQGAFLINCNHQLKFEESLREMMKGTASELWVRKFVFPHSLGREMRQNLYEANVHPFTLFPDLDGLGKLLKLKYDVFWSR